MMQRTLIVQLWLLKKGGYGWFVYVPEEDDDSLLEKEGTLTEDEAYMEKLLEFARENKAEWLMFDCDADTIQGLKTFSYLERKEK